MRITQLLTKDGREVRIVSIEGYDEDAFIEELRFIDDDSLVPYDDEFTYGYIQSTYFDEFYAMVQQKAIDRAEYLADFAYDNPPQQTSTDIGDNTTIYIELK